MKRIKYILILFISLVSCQDFLEEESQDLTAVETVEHFKALMLNEFNDNYAMFKPVYHMTDDLEEITLSPRFSKANKTTFTWQQEIEIDENGNSLRGINSAWEAIYKDIAIVNYVIESIDGMEGSAEQRSFVKGEAYFIRAMSYFNLLNLYGQPFNEASKNTDLGVPIRTNTEIEITFSRESVAAGYNQIESDLMEALILIENSGVEDTKWHPSVDACNLLMSRVKLYQRKWDEVIQYADNVIDHRQLAMLGTSSPFITNGNSELIFAWHKSYTGQIDPPGSSEIAGYKVSDQLIELYELEDNRLTAFLTTFIQNGETYYMNKKHNAGFEGSTTSSVYTTMGYQNMRVAEAYLNKAEALAQKQDPIAINVIQELHAKRISDVSLIVYPTEPGDILNYVYDERRRELCFEDHHRWFDLRRMDNRPEIVHVFTDVDEEGEVLKTETYTLYSNDLNYTLPIPIKERENNPGIVNNERTDKLPVVN